MRNGVVAAANGLTSSTTDQLLSNSEGDSDPELSLGRRLLTVCSCCQLTPPGSQGRPKYRRSRANGLSNNSLVIAVLFVVLTLAVLGLTYFAISLQGKIAALTLTLEPGRTFSVLFLCIYSQSLRDYVLHV